MAVDWHFIRLHGGAYDVYFAKSLNISHTPFSTAYSWAAGRRSISNFQIDTLGYV